MGTVTPIALLCQVLCTLSFESSTTISSMPSAIPPRWIPLISWKLKEFGTPEKRLLLAGMQTDASKIHCPNDAKSTAKSKKQRENARLLRMLAECDEISTKHGKRVSTVTWCIWPSGLPTTTTPSFTTTHAESCVPEETSQEETSEESVFDDNVCLFFGAEVNDNDYDRPKAALSYRAQKAKSRSMVHSKSKTIPEAPRVNMPQQFAEQSN